LNASHPDRRNPRRLHQTALGLLLATAATIALAAPPRVEAFDKPAWESLKAGVRKPTVVLFTATYCAVCPAVFDQVSRVIASKHLNLDLVGVVIDRSPGEDDAGLLVNTHLRQTSRLFAFDGNPQALRYAVDANWRGVTPFVAVLAPGQAPKLLVGAPTDQALLGWAGR
jgi:hypothetical protein